MILGSNEWWIFYGGLSGGCWGHILEEGNIDVLNIDVFNIDVFVACRGVCIENYSIYDGE